MMRTVDRIRMRAPVDRVFRAAADVQQWPALLAHYRWVRILERDGDRGVVEMAAWRPFGLFKYPTWWVSEMWLDREAPAVHYRHIRGITRGMNVVWRLEPVGEETEVTIVHQWAGPRWPVIGSVAARWIIGPVFIHGIASRTLAGIAHFVEGGEGGEGGEDGTGGGEDVAAGQASVTLEREARKGAKLNPGPGPFRSRSLPWKDGTAVPPYGPTAREAKS